MKLLWKIYFYLLTIVALTLISFIIFSLISDKYGVPTNLYLFILIDISGLVGLYGFIYKEPIFNNKTWIALGLLYFLKSGLVATGVVSITGGYDNTNIDIFGIGSLLFYIPQFYALFMYSKVTNEAWQKYPT